MQCPVSRSADPQTRRPHSRSYQQRAVEIHREPYCAVHVRSLAVLGVPCHHAISGLSRSRTAGSPVTIPTPLTPAATRYTLAQPLLTELTELIMRSVVSVLFVLMTFALLLTVPSAK